MNVLNILLSAARGGTLDALHEHTVSSEEESTETTPQATLPTVIKNDEVVSQKEQIITLLDAYNGRMWQQDVLAENGYSAGKVSRLLSEMEADGQITRYWKNGAKVVADPELLPAALTEK